MKLLCRALLGAILFPGFILASASAMAQDYPAREIHAICPFPPGSSADEFVRYFSEKLSALAGKPVIVENKGGSAGNTGSEAAAKSKADGYTILITPASSTLAAAPHLFKKLPFNPAKDFTPVTTLARTGYVIVVDAKSPYKSLADLSNALKEKGDRSSYGISSNTALITAELYKKYAGLKSNRIDYHEMQTALNDLSAGNVDFIVGDTVFAINESQSGKVRPLAVTFAQRIPALPNVPTLMEAGMREFGELAGWWGVVVPAKTPQPVVDKIGGWFNQISASEETKTFLTKRGFASFPGNSRSAADLLASDTKKWGEYVKSSGIEPK